MMSVLQGLEPENVFSYFEKICAIPHGSGNTKAISDFCVSFAKERGLRYRQDESNNVIIWKEGTEGYETSAPVIWQGHLDMVCEKESGCTIDFANDGVQLQYKDGFISAKGTTLGGDDGIAVAFALAILDSDDIPHPPLEVVFTVDEEIGMLGAAALDCSDLKARAMLNLDSEEEGYLLVSCAGGVTTKARIPIAFEEENGYEALITVNGLQGGHSGVEIDKGRGNACQILGRVLYRLTQTCGIRIKTLSGGLKDNAIPREAQAVVLIGGEQRQACRKETEALLSDIKNELALTDAGVQISLSLQEEEKRLPVMTEQTADNVLVALLNYPAGIQKMSFAIPDLVQTSLNLGILETRENEVVFSFSVRSSIESEKTAIVERIESLTKALGGQADSHGEYPAWEYRQNSPLREMMIQIYREKYGKEPVIQAQHAGVECGIFAGCLPELDCVSYGPDIFDIHTPKERMDVESVKRTWEYTLEILRRLR